MELRQIFHACGHEHRRPIDAVKADDVFAQEVSRGGPPSCEAVGVGFKAGDCGVVDEGVIPHIEHLAFVPRHSDAPIKRSSGDRDIG